MQHVLYVCSTVHYTCSSATSKIININTLAQNKNIYDIELNYGRYCYIYTICRHFILNMAYDLLMYV